MKHILPIIGQYGVSQYARTANADEGYIPAQVSRDYASGYEYGCLDQRNADQIEMEAIFKRDYIPKQQYKDLIIHSVDEGNEAYKDKNENYISKKQHNEIVGEIDTGLKEMQLLARHNHKKGEIKPVACPRCSYDEWIKKYLKEGK